MWGGAGIICLYIQQRIEGESGTTKKTTQSIQRAQHNNNTESKGRRRKTKYDTHDRARQQNSTQSRERGEEEGQERFEDHKKIRIDICDICNIDISFTCCFVSLSCLLLQILQEEGRRKKRSNEVKGRTRRKRKRETRRRKGNIDRDRERERSYILFSLSTYYHARLPLLVQRRRVP